VSLQSNDSSHQTGGEGNAETVTEASRQSFSLVKVNSCYVMKGNYIRLSGTVVYFTSPEKSMCYV